MDVAPIRAEGWSVPGRQDIDSLKAEEVEVLEPVFQSLQFDGQPRVVHPVDGIQSTEPVFDPLLCVTPHDHDVPRRSREEEE